MNISVVVLSIKSFFGLGEGLLEIALVCLILTFGAVFSWVVIGACLGFVERALYAALGRCFGYSFASLFYRRLTFPGIVLHEVSHAAFGMLTGARITGMSFFGMKGYLGVVYHENRGPAVLRLVQQASISCAPTVVGAVLGYFMLASILKGTNPLWMDILFVYLEICILNHGSMSGKDLSLYLSTVWVFILPVFALFMFLCL